MHGSILMALQRHVTEAHGASAWDAIRSEAGMPGRLFTSLGTYDDADVGALVAAACRLTGADQATVLQGFGRSLVTDLMKTYGSMVSPGWTAFDLLEHTEKTIHAVVRMRQPGSVPPVLRVTRRGPEAVSISYESGRRLCALARGIVLGIGDHFGTPLSVNEPECMLRKARACQIEVLPAWEAPEPRGAEEQEPVTTG